MKRLKLSEILLVSAPMALLVAGPLYFAINRSLNPPINPAARIILTLKPGSIDGMTRDTSQLNFSWIAKATNSPQRLIAVRFSERIVAIGRGKSLVLFSSPSGRTLHTASYTRNISQRSVKGLNTKRLIRFSWEAVPAWADKLEWQGTVVALPTATGDCSAQTSPATIRKLALTPGASQLSKRFPIALQRKPLVALRPPTKKAVS